MGWQDYQDWSVPDIYRDVRRKRLKELKDGGKEPVLCSHSCGRCLMPNEEARAVCSPCEQAELNYLHADN